MKIFFLFVLAHFTISHAHSTLGEPKPTDPRICRLGGTSTSGQYLTCPGPCDLRAYNMKRGNITSPTNPARIYRRGQLISVKYQRNNHGPGGFVRLSLVPIHRMMDKRAHAANAFHYSCWGAVAVRAKKNEIGSRNGYSLVGGDGTLHNLPISFHEVKVKIPAVVPDGDYVLGWVWYGGLRGLLTFNTPTSPTDGHFSDYWACAFVRIKGGGRVAERFTPVFEPNLKKYWGDGCWSANDSPGVCSIEPCSVRSKKQKPKEFQNGARPRDLTPANFRGPIRPDNESQVADMIPTPVPEHEVLVDVLKALYDTKRSIQDAGKNRKKK